jgi:hypothetical protein
MSDSEIWHLAKQKLDELEDAVKHEGLEKAKGILAGICREFEAVREDILFEPNQGEILARGTEEFNEATFNKRFPLAVSLLHDLDRLLRLEKNEAIKSLTSLKAVYFS